jgi:hypothetical protein
LLTTGSALLETAILIPDDRKVIHDEGDDMNGTPIWKGMYRSIEPGINAEGVAGPF